jgi:alkanesulfonate monooxygenase SsuD/methylene tetrahydromethanopterin reductase-like flavin-dependent oxidoreductase (luciferase family)
MGVLPSAPLTALRDAVGVLRSLLAGDVVAFDGAAHHLDGIRLDFPPGERLPIHVGAVNERALDLSGRVADGTILSVLASPDYVRWARDVVTRAAADHGRAAEVAHRLTTYVLYSVDDDPERAREAVRPAVAMFLAAEATSSLVRVPGLDGELAQLMAAGRESPLAPRIPGTWLDRFAVTGTPEQCARRLRELLDAGSDAVALWPLPTERADDVVELTAREVLPRLRR